MRSFNLKDLLTVKVIKLSSQAATAKDTVHDIHSGQQMLTIEDIQKKYKIDETAKTSTSWPFQFKLEFTQRCFTLSARTQRELDEWVRVFQLIEKMNKIGFSITDKNPYVFEDQQDYSFNQ